MALNEAFPGVSGVVDSLEARRNLAGLIVRDEAGVPRAGVLPRTTAALVTATSSTGPMTVNVATAWLVLVREGGVLFTQNNGTTSVTIGTAPVSNSRIDVVYAKQNESAAPMSDGADTAVIGVVAGTAAASPVKPSIPVGALELATVEIPSGVTATNQGGVVITQTYPYTATAGSPVWFRSKGAMDLWEPEDGSFAWHTGVQAMYLRTGGAWNAYSTHFVERARSTDQSIASGDWTTVTYPTSIHDGGGISYSGGTFTVSAPGRYVVNAQVAFDVPTTTAGQRVMRVVVNGSVSAQGTQVIPNATYPALSQVSKTVLLAAGDTVRVEAYQSSGFFQTLGVLQVSTWITIDRLEL